MVKKYLLITIQCIPVAVIDVHTVEYTVEENTKENVYLPLFLENMKSSTQNNVDRVKIISLTYSLSTDIFDKFVIQGKKLTNQIYKPNFANIIMYHYAVS